MLPKLGGWPGLSKPTCLSLDGFAFPVRLQLFSYGHGPGHWTLSLDHQLRGEPPAALQGVCLIRGGHSRSTPSSSLIAFTGTRFSWLDGTPERPSFPSAAISFWRTD